MCWKSHAKRPVFFSIQVFSSKTPFSLTFVKNAKIIDFNWRKIQDILFFFLIQPTLISLSSVNVIFGSHREILKLTGRTYRHIVKIEQFHFKQIYLSFLSMCDCNFASQGESSKCIKSQCVLAFESQLYISKLFGSLTRPVLVTFRLKVLILMKPISQK